MSDLEARMRARMAKSGPVTRKVGDTMVSADGDSAGGTVRITVDLTKTQHRALRMAALDAECSGMDVVRAFLDDLAAAGEASAAILAERLKS